MANERGQRFMRELKIRNFRDVSGYRNQYGQIMKKNKIFRGASLNMITLEDAVYMENDLHIRYILDYRDEKESLMAKDICFPHAVYERIGALQVSQATEQGFDFGTMLKGEMSLDKIKFLIDYISEGYRGMAFNNPAYHRLFELLLRNDGHVYFHCTAGKDRTGVSAFLIMMALGMSEEDGINEYLLSNEYLKAYNDAFCEKLNISLDMREYCDPLLYVQKENMMLLINSIKEKYNDYYEFLEKEYGIDEVKRKQLREIYCE